MAKGVSINVGSSSQNPNGRGPVDPSDFSFEYLPIPEKSETIREVPTYTELEWINQESITVSDIPVHLDPEFETYTYGHVKRGFGDMKLLRNLNNRDYLFFHSTLSKEENNSEWITAIIGYFEINEIVDCTDLSSKEIRDNYESGFKENAHFKRKNPEVDFLVKGNKESKLFERAIPLSKFETPRKLIDRFKDSIETSSGKNIKDETPWFRWTLKVDDPKDIIKMRFRRYG